MKLSFSFPCSKDVRLPVQLQRAMAAEAEAAREARAKVRCPSVKMTWCKWDSNVFFCRWLPLKANRRPVELFEKLPTLLPKVHRPCRYIYAHSLYLLRLLWLLAALFLLTQDKPHRVISTLHALWSKFFRYFRLISLAKFLNYELNVYHSGLRKILI